MNSKNGMYIVLLMKVVLIFALLATSANANPVNPANPRNLQSLHNSPLVDRFQHDQPVMKFGEKNQPMMTANVPTPIASEKTAIEENAVETNHLDHSLRSKLHINHQCADSFRINTNYRSRIHFKYFCGDGKCFDAYSGSRNHSRAKIPTR